MGYLLAFLAVFLAAAAGYWLGVHRRRAREDALKTMLEERSVQLTVVEQELLRRTSIDPVTQLPTQQYLQDFLEKEWRRASRERTTVSLLMIEVDHFRAYNERMGKPDGDACLRTVADALRPLVHRPSDGLARYGGPGRFGLVLGGTDAQGAMVLAERLRQSVENLQKPNPASTTGSIITISIGMTTTVPNREGPWQELQLIATAEKGLVQAAEAGRNRVVFEPGGKPVTPV